MHPYFEATFMLRKDKRIGHEVFRALLNHISTLSLTQAGALFAFCERRKTLFPDAYSLANALKGSFPNISHVHDLGDLNGLSLIRALANISSWNNWCEHVARGRVDNFKIGYWLGAVLLDGLSDIDGEALIAAMVKSGSTYDYRKNFPNDFLLRRYPTGALSEKVALIMPIIICALRHALELPVISPFIVARALGHTGGTWDKLLNIPGIELPQPGEPTLRLLATTGVSYTVTEADFNPADNRLYSLRSETDTIESPSLIVSSISSKMLACPVHTMQLDVRYGPGSFFPERADADAIGRRISRACSQDGMRCYHTLTDAVFPTGSSIGAALEVAEAIEALGGRVTGLFDQRGIDLQRRIVAEFVARIIQELPYSCNRNIQTWIMNGFRDGIFLPFFLQVFNAHGVRKHHAESLWNDPTRALSHFSKRQLASTKKGIFTTFDQLRIGRITNSAHGEICINLKVRPGDRVEKGSVICEVFTKPSANVADGALLEHFFIS